MSEKNSAVDASPHLLGLPLPIRHRIYSQISMLWDSGTLVLAKGSNNEYRRRRIRYTRSLLLTCKPIYTEISSLVYSTNRISIPYRNSGHLQTLSNLLPSSIACLLDLAILLNVSSCESGACCGTACSRRDDGECCTRYGRKHDEPLQVSSSRGQRVLAKWKDAAQFLARYIQPFHLRLYLICDVVDLETANAVVEPLLSLPTLALCDLRLGHHRGGILRDLAATTAHQVTTGQPLRQTTFLFLELPIELQLQILEYTDLIAPWGEVVWSPRIGYTIYHHCSICDSCHEYSSPEHYACKFLKCSSNSMGRGCYCSRYHAVSSTTCQCWEPPTSFLLVCRAMRDVAQTVFFSRNRFIIQSDGSLFYSEPKSRPNRLEIAIFLASIVPVDKLSCLGFLEIMLPPLEPNYFALDEPAYHDWAQTVEYLKDKLAFSKLTIRICMRDNFIWSPSVDIRRNLATWHGMAMQQAYLRIVASLTRLGRPRRFFVHAGWLEPSQKCYFKDLDDLERKLEQSVMGEGYDSSVFGKREESCSRWVPSFQQLYDQE